MGSSTRYEKEVRKRVRTIIVPKLDFEKTCAEVTSFIEKTVKDAGVSGVVVGLNGGVDSTLVATLYSRALGSSRVLGILLPTDFTPKQDIADAIALAKWLKIRTELINIQSIYDTFSKTLRYGSEKNSKIPAANVTARIRMTILYYYANACHQLVAGTGDQSEDLIGYFTKYGDGGVDFLPICHLYKTQVRELARYLGIPEKMAYKPSSPQLYPGHKATDEIPLDYEELDPILVGLFDLKLSQKEVSSATGKPITVISDVERRFIESKHKRAYPPMLRAW